MNPFDRGRQDEHWISMIHHSVVGKIRVEPRLDQALAGGVEDDSSLALVLSSFAHRAKLGDDLWRSADSAFSITARRIHWAPPSAGDVSVRANVIQLLDELEAEFQKLESTAS